MCGLGISVLIHLSVDCPLQLTYKRKAYFRCFRIACNTLKYDNQKSERRQLITMYEKNENLLVC